MIFQFGVGIDYVLRPVGYVLDKHVSPVKLSFLILFIYLLIRSWLKQLLQLSFIVLLIIHSVEYWDC